MIGTIPEQMGSTDISVTMSNEASRRQEFKKALGRLLPISGGTDYAAGIAMLENIFRAGVEMGRSDTRFDPDDRGPSLPVLSHDIAGVADGCLMRLRQAFFGKMHAYLPDVPPVHVKTAFLDPRKLMLKRMEGERGATEWQHCGGGLTGVVYTDVELKPLFNARLLRTVRDEDGQECLLLTRWGFEFLAIGRTLGDRDKNNVYHRRYDELTETLVWRPVPTMLIVTA
jgi:hypothetical protein